LFWQCGGVHGGRLGSSPIQGWEENGFRWYSLTQKEFPQGLEESRSLLERRKVFLIATNLLRRVLSGGQSRWQADYWGLRFQATLRPAAQD